ncbi:hypothetical protein BX600DRAFT_469545 [Xylariales sp. PMI_506]|nr:hypothetical protein BX600DRAFT_469545 [Xylariales sp. PMI_506]
MMSVFTTQNGYMGIGPSWLQTGDSINLIADAHSTYISAQADEVLRRRSRWIRDMLGSMRSDNIRNHSSRKQDLESELKLVESRVQQGDAWQLVGRRSVCGGNHEWRSRR